MMFSAAKNGFRTTATIRKDVVKICAHHSFYGMLLSTISLAGIVMSPVAMANPTGGTVVGGLSTITANGNTVDVKQTSERTIIDWSSFNIAKGETTQFFQPNANAIAINRVVNSSEASFINGNLLANGRVILINPNGGVIGADGKVAAASFIMTSADINNNSFMKTGALNFDTAGNADAVIENDGFITVGDEGLAALVAPTVRNNGIITGNLAKVQLAAADTVAVDFYGDGLINYAVASGPSQRTLTAENNGKIIADGGQVTMTAAAASNVVNSVINNTGVIQAHSLVKHNGQVILTGAGADVTDSGKIDVSGANGGGTVNIGGGYQGSGSLAHAKSVTITKDATIDADATVNGNGGTIVAYSDESTAVSGQFSAQGGANGGNGGLVETSSQGALKVDGASVDTLAANGNAGNWLLDPTTLNVDTSANAVTDPNGVDVSTIDNALSNVILAASKTINFDTDINIGAAGVSLSAVAGTAGTGISGTINDPTLGVTTTSLKPGSGVINLNGHYIRTHGGDIDFVSGNSINISDATLYTRGGNVNMSSGGITITGSGISTQGGDVNLTAAQNPAATGGVVSINTSSIDTTLPGATPDSDSTRIQLLNNGTPEATSAFGTGNTFDTSALGGKITISGHSISGSNNCFAAGGTACTVPDPLPYETIVITADALSKIYGSLDPALTYQLTSGTLLSGDSFTGALTRNPGENVGTYAILQGSVAITGGAGNYTLVYVGNFLTITPYTLMVDADPKSKVFGDSDPALTYTHGALVNGDTDSVFTGNLNRDPGEAVGQYAINQNTLSAGSNYTIDYVGNFLTITQLVVPQSLAPTFQIDPLGRPIISVADQAINYYPPFEAYEVKTLNTDVSLKIPTGSAPNTNTASAFNNLAPAAGGDESPETLANLAPAAGGDGNGVVPVGSTNSEIGCANNFLDNKPCL